MRIVCAVLLVALCVLAAATPQVGAQAPNPAPSVTVAFADETGTVTVDAELTLKGKVTNNGAASGTPLDEQNAGDTTVDLSGVPEGWVATVEPAHFRLAAGASQDITLTVSISAGASASKAELTIMATLRTPIERLDPILGNAPGGTQTATGSDTLSVTRDDSLTRDVLEAIGPWIYGVLLLMVAAVLVAVALSVASRRSLVRLATETRELTVAPGGRAVFPFQVEGLAKEPDTVLLQVSAVQEGWAAFLPVPELVLEPGKPQELSLVVLAPKDAAQQTRQAILVTATSAKAPRGAANVEFVAVVEGPIELAKPEGAPKRRK